MAQYAIAPAAMPRSRVRAEVRQRAMPHQVSSQARLVGTSDRYIAWKYSTGKEVIQSVQVSSATSAPAKRRAEHEHRARRRARSPRRSAGPGTPNFIPVAMSNDVPRRILREDRRDEIDVELLEEARQRRRRRGEARPARRAAPGADRRIRRGRRHFDSATPTPTTSPDQWRRRATRGSHGPCTNARASATTRPRMCDVRRHLTHEHRHEHHDEERCPGSEA